MSNTDNQKKVGINPIAVLEYLAQGKTRDEIRDIYGLSNKDIKDVFQHPDLKGRKTKVAPGFFFIENETPNANNSAPDVSTTENVANDVATGDYMAETAQDTSEEANNAFLVEDVAEDPLQDTDAIASATEASENKWAN